MTQEHNEIDQDVAKLDSGQEQESPAQEVISVPKADFEALQQQVSTMDGRFRTLQSNYSKTIEQIESQQKEAEAQADLTRLQSTLSELPVDDPSRPFAESVVRDKEQVVQNFRQNAADPASGMEPDTTFQSAELMAKGRQTLQDVGISPDLPGIDWEQDLSTDVGQKAWFRSAVQASRQAATQVASRQASQNGSADVNPSIQGAPPSGGGPIRSKVDNADAYATDRISEEQYVQNEKQLS